MFNIYVGNKKIAECKSITISEGEDFTKLGKLAKLMRISDTRTIETAYCIMHHKDTVTIEELKQFSVCGVPVMKWFGRDFVRAGFIKFEQFDKKLDEYLNELENRK